MPLPSSTCGDAARIQRGGYRPNACGTLPPEFGKDSTQSTGVHISCCTALHPKTLSVGGAQLHTSRFSCRECCLGTIADHFPLTLSYSSDDVQHHAIGRGYVAGSDLHTAFQQPADEVDVTGEPIELGDHQRRFVPLGVREGCSELRPVVTLPALHLGKGRDWLNCDEGANGSFLRRQSQARSALLGRAHPVVGYVPQSSPAHTLKQRLTCVQPRMIWREHEYLCEDEMIG